MASALELCKEWESSDEENEPVIDKEVVKNISALSLQDKSKPATNGHHNPFDRTTKTNTASQPLKESTYNPVANPKPLYIPARPSNDEADIFGQEIASGANFDKYAHIPVNVTGNNLAAPLHSFAAGELSTLLSENIRKSGYTNPTPIQQHAIPTILNGRDLMGCAQTGSGKTASFLVPIVQTLLRDERPMDAGKPHVVIVTPTRELAIQIYNEARKFAFGTFVKSCVVYGGTAFGHQASLVRRGCHILVATPGRLLDFADKHIVQFDAVRVLVLDEADRMLDMGFLDSMKSIVDHETMVSKTIRQTLMFSATFPEEIQKLAGAFLTDYVFIAVGIIGSACADVLQTIVEVNQYEKRERLEDLLDQDAEGIMVFVETKRSADFLANYIHEKLVPTTSIHGDRFQEQREKALADFKANRMKVLICTSVAARGLDIRNVKHVINYDLPDNIDEYVHRIGRTGRIGNQGRATSFFDPDGDQPLAAALVRILHQADQQVPVFLLHVGECAAAPPTDKRRSMFGGRDVRKQREFKSREPTAQEPNEDW